MWNYLCETPRGKLFVKKIFFGKIFMENSLYLWKALFGKLLLGISNQIKPDYIIPNFKLQTPSSKYVIRLPWLPYYVYVLNMSVVICSYCLELLVISSYL